MFWQNPKTEIMTVVKVTVVTVAVETAVIVASFNNNNLTPQQPMRCFWGNYFVSYRHLYYLVKHLQNKMLNVTLNI